MWTRPAAEYLKSVAVESLAKVRCFVPSSLGFLCVEMKFTIAEPHPGPPIGLCRLLHLPPPLDPVQFCHKFQLPEQLIQDCDNYEPSKETTTEGTAEVTTIRVEEISQCGLLRWYPWLRQQYPSCQQQYQSLKCEKEETTTAGAKT